MLETEKILYYERAYKANRKTKKMTIAKVDKIETYFDKLYAKYHYDDICHS